MAKSPTTDFQFTFIHASEYATMKWRNGKGETREIAVDHEEQFRWRISRAQLTESGPFAFPGYDRKVLFLGPESVAVKLPGENVRAVNPFECLSFSGDSDLHAEVKTPCEDLNLFTLRAKAHGNLCVVRFRANESYQFPLEGRENFVVGLAGEIEFLDPNADSRGVLNDGSTIRVSRADNVNLLNLRTRATSTAATCAWITVHL